MVPEPPTTSETVDRIIFSELRGRRGSPTTSRKAYNEVILRLAERGCDAVALACTEIPLLVRPDESPLPMLDSDRVCWQPPRFAEAIA